MTGMLILTQYKILKVSRMNGSTVLKFPVLLMSYFFQQVHTIISFACLNDLVAKKSHLKQAGKSQSRKQC